MFWHSCLSGACQQLTTSKRSGEMPAAVSTSARSGSSSVTAVPALMRGVKQRPQSCSLPPSLSSWKPPATGSASHNLRALLSLGTALWCAPWGCLRALHAPRLHHPALQGLQGFKSLAGFFGWDFGAPKLSEVCTGLCMSLKDAHSRAGAVHAALGCCVRSTDAGAGESNPDPKCAAAESIGARLSSEPLGTAVRPRSLSSPPAPLPAARSEAGLPSLIDNLDFPAIPHSGIRGNKITDLFTLFVQLMC